MVAEQQVCKFELNVRSRDDSESSSDSEFENDMSSEKDIEARKLTKYHSVLHLDDIDLYSTDMK